MTNDFLLRDKNFSGNFFVIKGYYIYSKTKGVEVNLTELFKKLTNLKGKNNG